MEKYDIVVIGAGSGGLTTAVGFSKIGKKVLLVEREHMGGECTNSGCIPSKALLHHAKSYYAAKQIAGVTPQSEEYRREAFSYVRSKVDAILAKETPQSFKNMGIDVVLGEAVFSTKCTIAVGGIIYKYKKAVIASGSSPRLMEIPGLTETDTLTNQNIFNLQDVPKKLLIIGSGPIGMEMAQAFTMLGSQVTIASIDSQFARFEDASISAIMQKKFEDLGITIRLNAYIQKVERGTAIFNIQPGDRVTDKTEIPFDKVLIAIGRVPNLPQGLEIAGIKHDTNGIITDKKHRTSNKYVYAVGDIAEKRKFTHTADDSARQVVTHIASKGLIRLNTSKAVPKVTYTQPEMAQVGMLWSEAVATYSADRIIRIEVPFADNDRANTDDATAGVLVVIARRMNGNILGAHIIGPAAGEILTIFTLAIDQNISMWKLQKLIFAYPTYSLIVKKAADQFVGRQLNEFVSDSKKSIRRHGLKIVAAGVWITAIIALNSYQTTQDLTTTQSAISLFNVITMTLWGPLLYVLLYAIRPVTFFPATALTILSGIFFGFLWGTVLTVFAATLAAGVAYWVGRFFGANLRLEDSVLGNSISTVREHTFSAVLTMRLIFAPFDLVSYAAGVLRTKFTPFIGATFLGIILGTATFVSIGASLDVEEFATNGFSLNLFEPKFLALSGGIFIASLLLSKFLKRWKAEA